VLGLALSWAAAGAGLAQELTLERWAAPAAAGAQQDAGDTVQTWSTAGQSGPAGVRTAKGSTVTVVDGYWGQGVALAAQVTASGAGALLLLVVAGWSLGIRRHASGRWGRAVLAVAALGSASMPAAALAVPSWVNYQGRILLDGRAAEGSGHFKFALLEPGGQVLWTHDGQRPEPQSFVTLPLADGHFFTALGRAPEMAPLEPEALQGKEPLLRVWFAATQQEAEAGQFRQLVPDLPFGSVPHSFEAQSAQDAMRLEGKAAADFAAADHTHADLASAEHTHDAGDLVAGTLAEARLPEGATLDSELSTHASDPGAHHARYADPEAVAAVLAADGSGSGLDADLLDGLDADAFMAAGSGWSLTGNAGTTGGAHFLGTTDAVALDLRVQDQRALRLEPSTDVEHGLVPTVVGGSDANLAGAGVVGAAVGGGGRSGAPNQVGEDFGAVAGGLGNSAGGFAAAVGGGEANSASGPWSTAAGGTENQASGDSSAVGGGHLNQASALAATVGGGVANRAAAAYATIGGGGWSVFNDPSTGNLVTDQYGTVGGGAGNQAGDGAGSTLNRPYSTVGGGLRNRAINAWSTVGGGVDNLAGDPNALPGGDVDPNAPAFCCETVAGGVLNSATGVTAFIGGGYGNVGSNNDTVVAGGFMNTASGYRSNIGGGDSNRTSGAWSTVGGGFQNVAGSGSAILATVAGGRENEASASHATVGGGWRNHAEGQEATIVGGFENTANGFRSFVGGGWHNQAMADFATISGGGPSARSDPNSPRNRVLDEFGTVGGGGGNQAGGGAASQSDRRGATVSGGINNTASGEHSAVPGGELNTAGGNWSFAAGRRAKANDSGCFVWGDSSNSDFSSQGPNTFSIRSTNGLYLLHGSRDPNGPAPFNRWGLLIDNSVESSFLGGVRLSNSGFLEVSNEANDPNTLFARLDSTGTWTTVSDGRLKTAVEPLTGLLDKALALRPVLYRFKSEGPDGSGSKHLGFIAQEVEALLPSLVTDGEVKTLDYARLSVVAIGALQEQQARLEQQEKAIAALRAELASLKADMRSQAAHASASGPR
jgi:hypothetical protein